MKYIIAILSLTTGTYGQPGRAGRGPGAGAGGNPGTTCSSTVPTFLSPSASNDCESWHANETYSYPSQFQFKNEFAEYTCPSSGVRIIVSNGIPNHQVTVNNPNSPCVINWQVEIPLNPTKGSGIIEPQALGIVAIATNGVPVYGAQEGGGSNAVAPSAGSRVQDAQYWWGHAAPSHDWHYHFPSLGRSRNWGEDVLLGYALDGYPIYGAKTSVDSLDSCNFDSSMNRYHVRTIEQVDGDGEYCDGDSAAIQWNYTIGCYVGSLSKTKVLNSNETSIPSDCVLVNGKEFKSSTSSSSSKSNDGGSSGNQGPGQGGTDNERGPRGQSVGNGNQGGGVNRNRGPGQGPPGQSGGNQGGGGNGQGTPGQGGDSNGNNNDNEDGSGRGGNHRGFSGRGSTGSEIEEKIEDGVHGKFGLILLTAGALTGICVFAVLRKFCHNYCTSRYPKSQQISHPPLRQVAYYLAPKDLEGA